LRQEPKHVVRETARTLPVVIEKLGDHKDKYRVLAAQCLTTFWRVAPMDVERAVQNTGMVGKNSRAKEASMQWIVQVWLIFIIMSLFALLTFPHQMHNENGLQFRGFVPNLMELLEDADGMVRDNARNAVIELFMYVTLSNTPDSSNTI